MNTSTFFSSLKVACLGLLVFTASCKKDPDAITPDQGSGGGGSSLAVAGKNLRMVALATDPAMDFDGDGKVDNNLLAFMPECALDNTINFQTNGKISGSEGGKVCPNDGGDPDPTDIKEGTWTYEPKTQILRITTGGDATDWKVLSATGSTLKVSLAMDSDEGDKMSLIMTWQAQ
jgi:hypothetical protein